MLVGILSILALSSIAEGRAAPFKRTVDTTYPYKGPRVPNFDLVDQSIAGNGQGFTRLFQPPAVEPDLGTLPTNNINVISLAYIPGGMNVHFQTPYGIGEDPYVIYGTDPTSLSQKATGWSSTYDRTPPCSEVHVTQCSQHFHNVPVKDLSPATKYYYQIIGGNGTKPSTLLDFTTGRVAGDKTPFEVVVVNDVGFTNAQGTHTQMLKAITDGSAFVVHGGDIAYADDISYGISPCSVHPELARDSKYQSQCYNGSESVTPGGVDNPDFYIPVPEGEIANQGSIRGGDAATMYEVNWDIWQQWMNPIASTVPYMVLPGNHEAACVNDDNSDRNETSAVYELNLAPGSSANDSSLTYYSCPPSQRNFTAYRHRFTMPGKDPLEGSGNFWYSFSYGLAHFIHFSGETDYPDAPEPGFAWDLKGNETFPTEKETKTRNAGPFGYVNGDIHAKESYEQWQWMKQELASVDRAQTPWLILMSHRPMYSSKIESNFNPMRSAWEQLFLDAGVDVYISGHIHFNERMFPLGRNGTIDLGSIVNNNTYLTNPGKSLIHLVNGQGGNIESHSELIDGDDIFPLLNTTAFLDTQYVPAPTLTAEVRPLICGGTTVWFIHGEDGSVADYLWIHKNGTLP